MSPSDPVSAEARVEWLSVASEPDAWRELGLVVVDGLIPLIGTCLRVVPSSRSTGVVGWALSGVDASIESVAGLATEVVEPQSPVFARHELGATALDHVVVMTGDLEATTSSIAAATGCELKRVREVGPVRQGFHRIGRGGLIVEVVKHVDDDERPPSFWGVVINVDDLDAACARIGPDLVSEPRDAVQPGRRIATVRDEAGLGTKVALMSV